MTSGVRRVYAVGDNHVLDPDGPSRPGPARRLAGRVRAWMVLLPVDALVLASPAVWERSPVKAYICFGLLAALLATGGERYRARLHLALLDALPQLVGKPLTAAAVVATVIAFRHDMDGVVLFLSNATIAIGLAVLA